MASPILVNERSVRKLSEFEFVHNPKDEKSKLGVGSFASVKLAKEKRSGKMQAIKIVTHILFGLVNFLFRCACTLLKSQLQIFII